MASVGTLRNRFHDCAWAPAAAVSSLVLRISTFVFLRWIPGHHLPPLILGSLVVYLFSFFHLWKNEKRAATEKGNAKPDLGRQVTGKAASHQVELEKKASKGDQGRTSTSISTDILGSFLTGLPSPLSGRWNVFMICSHFLLAWMAADMVYTAPFLYASKDLSFVKIGYVSDTTARLLVREPDRSKLPLYVSYQEAKLDQRDVTKGVGREDPWMTAAKAYEIGEDIDYTLPVDLKGLKPYTQYNFVISNGHSGSVTTLMPAGLDDPGSESFTFLTSSCIKPRFPYHPFDHPLTIPGFQHLASWLPFLNSQFMLFLGDFIYIDVPRRLGTDVSVYRREYRQVYASPDWESVSQIPWIHVYDDHEIANDWDGNTTAPYPAAIDPFNIYHHSVNPPSVHQNSTYYTFTAGPASFLLLDTRRYRTPSSPLPATDPSKSMLGARQLTYLLDWLEKPEVPGVHWKIIISSIPFTLNWRINAQDTWAGYLHERAQILEKIWQVSTANPSTSIVILSGDRHEFAATKFVPPPGSPYPPSAAAHEFSTSPLSMFYLPVRSYWEDEKTQGFKEGLGNVDKAIKYVPDGNSKFGAVEIRNEKGGEQSSLRFRLFVDGIEAWTYVVTTGDRIGRWERGREGTWS